MNNKPTWVIFDVGGVLFDFESVHQDVADHLRVNRDLVTKKISQYVGDKSELGTISSEEIINDLLNEVGAIDQFDKVRSLWWSRSRWLNDSLVLMSKLRNAGYKIGIFSNNWRGTRAIVENEVTELKYVSQWFESSVEKLRKPDEKFYKLIENRLGTKGEDLYFIDDALANIEMARSRGWQTYHYSLSPDLGQTSNTSLRSQLL